VTKCVFNCRFAHRGKSASSKASCFWKDNENLSDCVQADIRRILKAAFEAVALERAIEGGRWHNVKDDLLEGFPMRDFPGFHQGGWIFCFILSLTSAQDNHHLYNAWTGALLTVIVGKRPLTYHCMFPGQGCAPKIRIYI
jgi:hypothetical protein